MEKTIAGPIGEFDKSKSFYRVEPLDDCSDGRAEQAVFACCSWSPIRVQRRMDDNLNDPVTIEAIRTIELNAIGV